jgi:ABC-type oligopeptide transport system substrate-binding subunit
MRPTRLQGQGKRKRLSSQVPGKAVQNAIAATDFETKQKLVHEAISLMIDKYCLVIPVWKAVSASVNQKYVKNHSMYTTPFEGQWTPEDTFLER